MSTNPWIAKVKAYQTKHNVSYKEALIASSKNKTQKVCPPGCVKKPKAQGKKGKKQKGGFLPLVALAGLAASGAVSGAAGFGVNRLLSKLV